MNEEIKTKMFEISVGDIMSRDVSIRYKGQQLNIVSNVKIICHFFYHTRLFLYIKCVSLIYWISTD